MDRGPWTVDRGPWTVDRGPWTVDRGPWTVDQAGHDLALLFRAARMAKSPYTYSDRHLRLKVRSRLHDQADRSNSRGVECRNSPADPLECST
ncbi:hypothetical protein Cus16_1152 [Curtobacterium sp. ER1/6]|nr:hypothetical protein Cus16_1152 [Curtobacterium sp. ER1/6]